MCKVSAWPKERISGLHASGFVKHKNLSTKGMEIVSQTLQYTTSNLSVFIEFILFL